MKLALGAALGFAGAVLLFIVFWLATVYTGAYNVAASDEHTDAVRWTFDKSMHRSVAQRADAVQLPNPLPPDFIAKGAQYYAESCAYCHGAPGEEPAHWSRSMRPKPPHLTEAASEWSAAELHWIISNGIKMSGMPAFGKHHASEEIVALTAFVSAMPGLTAQDYTRMKARESTTSDSR